MSARLRRRMYDKLIELARQQIEIWLAIGRELEREGIGSGQPHWQRRRTVDKAKNDRIEAWEDRELGIDPPEPRTPLEDLLQENHRLSWAAMNLADDIEKQFGFVSPLLDPRPGPAERGPVR
jgi:hypothetical protein